MWVIGLLLALLGCVRVQATKAVFAHFMVENAKTWDEAKWEKDIDLAREAHIDGFALNIRSDDKSAYDALNTAFQVADTKGDFHMILSFDYAGGGPWSANIVQQYILQFSAYNSYFIDEGQPVVSTFEGPGNSGDWELIKRKTNALFIPDWSSLGAKQALDKSAGVVDGLFSWSAWPWGNMDMNTYVDASYLEFMNTSGEAWGKKLKYMMPASPWFYTNLPGYDKNWMWRGDSMWFDRWQQIIFLNPDYVQIISWNDFGESHHIGPLYVDGDDYQAFTVGEAPFNYAQDMPHDGWRQFLPFVIDLYKGRKATITQEGLSGWYRVTPKQSGCDDGWTTGNTVSQLQKEFYPYEIVEDKIFYTALLTSHQDVKVTVGGVDLGASWTREPEYGSGLYHGSVAYGGNRGAVVITVGGMTLSGREITNDCNAVQGQDGKQNWNAWVGSKTGGSANKAVDISKWVCIEGSAPGAPEFNGLCEFTCKYGYCPPGACYCSNMGAQREEPGPDTPGYGTVGYPAEGASASYQGLCTFACNLGYCPSEYCDTKEHPLVVPNVSPFTPDACTSGEGGPGLEGLCSYACNFGFCPIHSCTCLTMGALHEPPAQGERGGSAKDGLDPHVYEAICNFACSRDYCPPDSCVQDGGDGHESGNPVYLGTEIYGGATAHCEPPCIFVLPPSSLPSTTTITPPAYTTSIQIGTSTSTVTVTPKAITVGSASFSNVPVSTSATDGAAFVACTSLAIDPVDVTITYTTNGRTSVTTRELTLPPWPQMTQGPPDKWTETCDVWGAGITEGNGDTPPKTTFTPKVEITSTVSTPIPTWTQFPPGTIEDDDEDDDDDDDVVVVGCDGLWFFNFCIDFPEFKVSKWKIRLPTGIIGPGPPPPSIILRDGWTVKYKGDLPPWPKVTIPPGPNPPLNKPDKPSDCTPVSQEVQFETVSLGLSVSSGKTVTTTSSTITRTAYVYGCEVPEYTETISSCEIKRSEPTPALANIALAEITAVPTVNPEAGPEGLKHELEARQAGAGSIFDQDNPIQWENDMSCPGGESDWILYPNVFKYAELANLRARLDKWKGTNNFDYIEARSSAFDVTAYFVVKQMPRSMEGKLKGMKSVRYLYDYQNFLRTKKTYTTFGNIGRKEAIGGDLSVDLEELLNGTYHILGKRDSKQAAWHLSQLGAPEGTNWLNDNNYVATQNSQEIYNYFYDKSAGDGQVVYVVEDAFPQSNNHPEFANLNGQLLEVPSYGPVSNWDPWHGAAVVAAVAGQNLGVAPKAKVISVSMGGVFQGDQASERTIHALLMIADHIKANNLQGKAVINMSWGVRVDAMHSIKPYGELLYQTLGSLQKDYGVVLVTASGNSGHIANERSEKWYPQKFSHDGSLPEMLVVGSVDKNAKRAGTSNYFTNNSPGLTYAWGHNVLTPNANGGYSEASGTSFAAPMVAGLVAYFRGLNPQSTSTLADPAKAVELVRKMVRMLKIDNFNVISVDTAPDSLVWNGQIKDDNCLLNKVQGCPTWLSPGGGSNSGGSFTYSSGSPSPTCTAGCGVLCTGYYCDAKPTGTPPDFADPANPTVTIAPKPTTITSKPAAAPTTTKAADPNADVPKVECDKPADCDSKGWRGTCKGLSNDVICLASKGTTGADGVPTLGQSYCACLSDVNPSATENPAPIPTPDVPKVECDKPADCEEKGWQRTCPGSNNYIICLASSGTTGPDGTVTIGQSYCACRSDVIG